jgi:ribA/ribD-fused uncharacterized protein
VRKNFGHRRQHLQTLDCDPFHNAPDEAAYMSAKSDDILWQNFCKDPFNSPGAIKKRSKIITIKENWADIKLSVMEECLRCKFSYPHTIEMLLLTGDQNIVEGNTWNDRFWGVDLKETPNIGENHLGRLLMKIRDEFLATCKIIL